MREEELEALWNDPKNYKGNYAVYYCKKDPRVIVPKRRRWAGWTLNFAHWQAYWVLARLFLMVLLPAAIAKYIWPDNFVILMSAFLLGGVGVLTWCTMLHNDVNQGR